MNRWVQFAFLMFLISCSSSETPSADDEKENAPPNEDLYFPPVDSEEWETESDESLSWNTENIPELYDFLEENGTRAFLVLKNGRIVYEQYWGKTILGNTNFNQNSNWYWASAGKTITAFLTGVAQEQGYLNISDPASDYLGDGWTSIPSEKESQITIRHQLTMTTGLDYEVADLSCFEPGCLHYKADAGSQWYYHNAPYTLLDQVISNASGMDLNAFTSENLEIPTGMEGTWIYTGNNNVYWSTARDMARFGILMLNKGSWEEKAILDDIEYYNAMVSTSQDLNPSYGYLWWLNGKGAVIFPGSSEKIMTNMSPNAPEDLIVAAGMNGQFLCIVPSEDLIVVRMGEAPDGSLVPVQFHDFMWEKLSKIIF